MVGLVEQVAGRRELAAFLGPPQGWVGRWVVRSVGAAAALLKRVL